MRNFIDEWAPKSPSMPDWKTPSRKEKNQVAVTTNLFGLDIGEVAQMLHDSELSANERALLEEIQAGAPYDQGQLVEVVQDQLGKRRNQSSRS